MTITRRIAAFGLAAAALVGCGSKFRSYDGPEVTRVIVFKKQRRMLLLHQQRALKVYNVALGFEPVGDKKIYGDGKTPEGQYMIDRRNPDSRFHLSLGIDYPRPADIAEAEALGEEPGGDIFIHGRGRLRNLLSDWTWGCIAVTNDEMEEVYSMVRTGTPISIYP
ncbi:MAG: L,D-transpeptidase family protein [Pseudomonadota bacterium]